MRRGPTGAARVAGVVGSPVAQSLSPLIHGAWIDATGLDAIYAPFAATPDGFARLVDGLGAGGLVGVNVTAPFKGQALALADRADAAAHAAGAANLLLFDGGGRVEARNTDGAGVIVALSQGDDAWDAAAGPAVIFGAGGAAAGAAAALHAVGARDLRFVVRAPERAGPLAERWGAQVFAFDAMGLALDGARLAINATTCGLNGRDPLRPPWPPPPPGAVALDMVYRPLRTAFLASAAQAGWRVADGLAMLIGQARPSFTAFFGVEPPAIDVRALCLRALSLDPQS